MCWAEWERRWRVGGKELGRTSTPTSSDCLLPRLVLEGDLGSAVVFERMEVSPGAVFVVGDEGAARVGVFLGGMIGRIGLS